MARAERERTGKAIGNAGPEPRRRIPSVDALLRSEPGRRASVTFGRPLVKHALSVTLEQVREAAERGTEPPPDDEILARALGLTSATAGGLVRVINATGVVLHTGLGRAPLPARAAAAAARAGQGYVDLEVDRATGARERRSTRAERLLTSMTGAENALVVNNGAAALLLALASLARGKGVVVSRGELIEIGGEFRIPDIMRRSGAILREVGTTNRTHLKDYANAIGPRTGLILKVHTSNYRVVGFTAAVASRELAELGRARGIPVMEDLGSGCFVDLTRYGFPYEPTVPEVVASGVDLVSFSGDKLLGGPQAGILVGRAELIERLVRNPLNRALRIDKFTVAALEATLYAYEAGTALETIPTLRMLTEPIASIRRRVRRVLARVAAGTQRALGAHVVESRSQVGGGALPTVELPTAAVALGTPGRPAEGLDEALRSGRPPVLGHLLDDHLLLDCRTVLPGDVAALATRLSSL